MTLGGMGNGWGVHFNSFIQRVHQLVAWGYDDIRGDVTPDNEEEEITDLLVKAIRRRIDDPSTPEDYMRFTARETSPVPSSEVLGKKRKEYDIVIEFAESRPHVEFIWEAKRLKTNGFPISKYTGDEGMLCYVRDEYAAESSFAGMLGYMQSDTSSRWFGELKRKFSEEALALGTITDLYDVSIPTSVAGRWISEHSRSSGNPIRIYHVFLDCCMSSIN